MIEAIPPEAPKMDGDVDPGDENKGKGKGRGKGKGKGKGKFGKGKGKFDFYYDWFKGKGKGKDKGKGQVMLRVDPALKVWIGNLAESTDWKGLQKHMNQAGRNEWVEIFSGNGKGSGAVVYSTPEDAAKAITELNGTELDGQNIIVDPWVRQARQKPEEKPETGDDEEEENNAKDAGAEEAPIV